MTLGRIPLMSRSFGGVGRPAEAGGGGGFDAFAHEPAAAGDWVGYSVRTERDFNALDEDGWQDDEFNQSNIAFVSAPDTLPHDDGSGNALRITYPDGFGDGSAPNTSNAPGLGSPTRVYISTAFRYSASFDGYGYPNKLLFLRGSWGNGPFIAAVGSGSADLEIDVDLQGTAEGSNPVGDANEVSAAARAIGRDKWYALEIIMIRNSASGVADGSIEIYMGSPEDGTEAAHAISVQGIEFGTGSFGSGFPFQISPTYGGNSGATHSGEGHLYFGHFYVGGV